MSPNSNSQGLSYKIISTHNYDHDSHLVDCIMHVTLSRSTKKKKRINRFNIFALLDFRKLKAKSVFTFVAIFNAQNLIRKHSKAIATCSIFLFLYPFTGANHDEFTNLHSDDLQDLMANNYKSSELQLNSLFFLLFKKHKLFLIRFVRSEVLCSFDPKCDVSLFDFALCISVSRNKINEKKF